MVRKWLFLMLVLLSWPVQASSQVATQAAQNNTMTVTSESRRYSLEVPADWYADFSTPLNSAIVGETIHITQSRAVYDAWRRDRITGQIIIAEAVPAGLFQGYSESLSDKNLIRLAFGTAGAEGTIEFLSIVGYEAGLLRGDVQDTYADTDNVQAYVVVANGVIVFIRTIAPDETPLETLDTVVRSLSIFDASGNNPARFPLKLDGGTVYLPLEPGWFVLDWPRSTNPLEAVVEEDEQSETSQPQHMFLLPEKPNAAVQLLYGQESATGPMHLPGTLVHVGQYPYDFMFGSADVAPDDSLRREALDRLITRSGGHYDPDTITQQTIGLAPVLTVEVGGVYGGENRAKMFLIDANYKIYTVMVAGPAAQWQETQVNIVDHLLAALDVIQPMRTIMSGDTAIGAQIGLQAPNFTVTMLDGTTKQLTDFRGKVVLLNFWASWCPPCREEMPLMQRIVQERDDVVVLALNAREEPPIVANYAKALQLNFPIGLDRDGSVMDVYNVTQLPTTYVIDAAGIIRRIPLFDPEAGTQGIIAWIEQAQG